MSVETQSDTELIAAAAAGDRAAYDSFVARHQAAVYRFAWTLTRDAAKAEDALQETFIAAWRSAASFRDEASARTWLLAIARNAVNRLHRRRADEPADFASLEELGTMAGWGADDDPERSAMRRQNAGILRRALQSLPEEDHEIIVLRDLEGLSGEETAAVLGVTLAGMKTRLHRARLRLAAALRKEDS
jgi:RNA polymerase sigma-70 factor (ECF subfamily)